VIEIAQPGAVQGEGRREREQRTGEASMQYLEDLVVGAKQSFGRYEVTREEVLEFARKYDPQPFHLDDAAAARTHFGRLAASGWHTCAMTMAMIVENITATRRPGSVRPASTSSLAEAGLPGRRAALRDGDRGSDAVAQQARHRLIPIDGDHLQPA
jgi:hypothetical protein